LTIPPSAEAPGNLTAASRQRGRHRSQFYEDKRRVHTHGPEGLKDLPPVPKSQPLTTPAAVVTRILEISLPHPAGAGSA